MFWINFNNLFKHNGFSIFGCKCIKLISFYYMQKQITLLKAIFLNASDRWNTICVWIFLWVADTDEAKCQTSVRKKWRNYLTSKNEIIVEKHFLFLQKQNDHFLCFTVVKNQINSWQTMIFLPIKYNFEEGSCWGQTYIIKVFFSK